MSRTYEFTVPVKVRITVHSTNLKAAKESAMFSRSDDPGRALAQNDVMETLAQEFEELNAALGVGGERSGGHEGSPMHLELGTVPKGHWVGPTDED